MADDVYTTEQEKDGHSLRYIHVVIRNTLGIVNRVTSLIRRRRFFIEEISVSFDETGLAHIIFSIDGRMFDIQQVMQQLMKLHDVLDVYEATSKNDHIYHSIFVEADNTTVFDSFPIKPGIILKEDGRFYGAFVLPVLESIAFEEYLKNNKHHYARRLTTLT